MPIKGPRDYYPQPKGTFARDQSGQKTFSSIDRTFSSNSTDFQKSSSIFDDYENQETTLNQPELYQMIHPSTSTSSANNATSTNTNHPKRSHSPQQFPHNSQSPQYQETYFDEAELSLGLPSDLPSGLVDIEGNIVGNMDLPFGQELGDYDDDDMSSIDEENHQNDQDQNHQNNKAPAKLATTTNPHTNSQTLQDHLEERDHADDGEDVNKIVGVDSTTGVHRKKSILRYNRSAGGCSVNSFNGSAGGSSIISDGKMGSSFNSQFYNNFYTRAARRNDFQRYTRGPYAPLDRCNSTSASSANSSTITQHYYPEGGWGYVVLATALFSHALLCGFLLDGGIFCVKVLDRFGHELREETVWLTSLSLGVGLLLSPIWVSICKRKSTRLTAVFGGLVTSLGCLFTSFASQFHQLFFSYGVFMGVGVGLTRDASMLMVGQYFKRKRDFVEILFVSGSGLGILVMSVFMEYAISSIGWRLGLQAVTGSLVLVFLLGSCYRSASLYHPQRRAIIHLKNQKRKIKEKEKKSDRPPFLDFSCLTSPSLQILLVSCAFTAWGLYSPLFHLAVECYDEAVGEADRLLLYVYIGLGWILGCFLFGFLTVQRNEDCRISKLYLCQVAALITGISIIALTNVKEQSGLVTFSWVYGLGLGGYNYMLKAHTYEKVRARVFPRAWSFIQSVQGMALLLGIPVTGYINTSAGWRKGYFVSAGSIFLGFFIMFISAVGSGQLTRHKSSRSSMKTCETTDSIQSPGLRRISFTFPDEQLSPPRISKESRSSCSERSVRSVNVEQPKELTRISEEGILDTNH